MVGHIKGIESADLELPLARHHLGIDAKDANPSGQACIKVSLHSRAAEHLIGTNPAIVTSLWRGESHLRKSERPVANEERVLLLNAEDKFQIGVFLGRRGTH